jgi:hypothetical protein
MRREHLAVSKSIQVASERSAPNADVWLIHMQTSALCKVQLEGVQEDPGKNQKGGEKNGFGNGTD